VYVIGLTAQGQHYQQVENGRTISSELSSTFGVLDLRILVTLTFYPLISNGIVGYSCNGICAGNLRIKLEFSPSLRFVPFAGLGIPHADEPAVYLFVIRPPKHLCELVPVQL